MIMVRALPSPTRVAALLGRSTPGHRIRAASTSRSNELQNWISGPLEIAAFLPRVTAGAILSASDKLALVQPRLEKLAALANNSALSLEEKQAKVLAVVEADVLEFLEKGADVEASLLSQLKTVLPESVSQQIPTPMAPTRSWSSDAPVREYDSGVYMRTEVVAQGENNGPVPMPTRDAQTAAALVELRTAVSNVRECIAQFKDNADPTRVTMLRMNVQEARDRLALRVMEIDSSSASQTPGLVIAIDEAQELLADVNSEL